MRSREVLKLGETLLRLYDGEDARFIAGLFLEHVTGLEIFRHYTDNIEIDSDEEKEFFEMILRRISGEPVQYILGWVSFMGLSLVVEEGVFIPRPETEELVEIALKSIEHIKNPVVFDIGTGSGAIGIAIAHFREDAKVYMTDISEKACEIAGFNVSKLGLSDRVNVFQGDLFKPLLEIGPADIVVSNPPYIPSDYLKELPLDVQREPVIALNGGKNGTDIINRILDEAWIYLKKKGVLLIEIDGVNLDYIEVPYGIEHSVLKDSMGKTRFVLCRRKL